MKKVIKVIARSDQKETEMINNYIHLSGEKAI